MAPELIPEPEAAHVMVVEDDVLIRTTIAEVLRTTGLRVIEAASADEAWSYLVIGAPVDLIFSDIDMPGSMDGLQLAQKVRDNFAHIAVLLTSGGRSISPAEHPHFIAKPYRGTSVVTAITNLLQNKTDRNTG